MKTNVIVISGKQGSGKTTLVNEFKRLYNREDRGQIVVEIRFAAALYSMHDHCRDFMRGLGIALPDKNGRLLQLLGTEWVRNEVGPDAWVKIAKREIAVLTEAFEPVADEVTFLISDCRFRNEFEAFPKAFRVRLECPEATRKLRCDGWRDTSHHPSEVDLDDYARAGRFSKYFNTDETSPTEIAVQIKYLSDRPTLW